MSVALSVHDIIFSEDFAFANNAAANTAVNKTKKLPQDRSQAEDDYVVFVHNPGAVAITVLLQNRETINSVEQFATARTINVGAGATVQSIGTDFPLGDGFRVRVTNDALVGVAGAFTAHVRIRKV